MGYSESVIGVSGSCFKFVEKKTGQIFQIFRKNKLNLQNKRFPGRTKVYKFFQQNLSENKILVSILDLLLLLITNLLYSAHTALIGGTLVNTS
jgi:hypothetical protein